MLLKRFVLLLLPVLLGIVLHFAFQPRTRNRDLFLALQKSDYPAVKALIQQGADVNAVAASGGTPLLMAIRHNDDKTVQWLIAKGADVNLTIKPGQTETPLMAAVQRINVDVVKLLLAHGVEVNAKESNGYTAMRFAESCATVPCDAASFKRRKLIRPLLLRAGAKRFGI